MGYKIKDHSDKSAVGEPVVALSSKEQFLFFVEATSRVSVGRYFIGHCVNCGACDG